MKNLFLVIYLQKEQFKHLNDKIIHETCYMIVSTYTCLQLVLQSVTNASVKLLFVFWLTIIVSAIGLKLNYNVFVNYVFNFHFKRLI